MNNNSLLVIYQDEERLIKYFNDCIKNLIPRLTKKHKPKFCTCCKRPVPKQIQAAHKVGFDRKRLIKKTIQKLSSPFLENYKKVNLDNVYNELVNIHKNPKLYNFICSKCHNFIDKSINKNIEISNMQLVWDTDFAAFLKTIGLEDKTISHYTKTMPSYLENTFGVKIFHISNPKDIQTLIQVLDTNDIWIKKNETSNNLYSCALKQYLTFSQSKEIRFLNFLKNKGITEEFSYHYAFFSPFYIKEKFNINLYDIKTPQEGVQQLKHLLEIQEFKELNQKRDNIYIDTIGHYISFLEEETKHLTKKGI